MRSSIARAIVLAAAAASGTGVGCAAADDADGTAGAAALSNDGSCSDNAPSPCTPAVGSTVRSFIATVLRESIKSDLAKNGVEPQDADVKFVFKTMVTERGNVYVAATIKKSDGVTDFDFHGTQFDGQPGFVNSVQSLLEIESGAGITHKIGIGTDPTKFACAWLGQPNFPRDLYPGANPAKDCPGGPPADPDTSCTSDEQTLFSCTSVDLRQVALCAPKDLSSTGGYVQLRFGNGSGVFAIPDDAHRAQFRSVTKAQTVSFSSGSGDYIELDDRQRYIVYRNDSDAEGDSAGLVEMQGDTVLDQHKCNGAPVSQLGPDSFSKVAFPEGPGSFDFDP